MTKEYNEISDAYQRNMFAEAKDRVDILTLYKQLPDTSITSEYDESLYHLAARFTDADAIQFLKEAGLKPGTDKYGNTALHALTTTRFDFDDPKLDEVALRIYNTAQALLDAGFNPKRKMTRVSWPTLKPACSICIRSYKPWARQVSGWMSPKVGV